MIEIRSLIIIWFYFFIENIYVGFEKWQTTIQ